MAVKLTLHHVKPGVEGEISRYPINLSAPLAGNLGIFRDLNYLYSTIVAATRNDWGSIQESGVTIIIVKI